MKDNVFQLSHGIKSIHQNKLYQQYTQDKRLFVVATFKDLSLFFSQKQPPRGVRRKRCSENMQQNYRRTPMPKCDFNKVAKQCCKAEQVAKQLY